MSLVECLELPDAGCSGCGQHPKVWVPMESSKGSTMESSLVIRKKWLNYSLYFVGFMQELGTPVCLLKENSFRNLPIAPFQM